MTKEQKYARLIKMLDRAEELALKITDHCKEFYNTFGYPKEEHLSNLKNCGGEDVKVTHRDRRSHKQSNYIAERGREFGERVSQIRTNKE